MDSTHSFYSTVLCIAGLDPSAGAGLLSDIKTCQALGCYGLGVATALTAQNHIRVDASLPVSSFILPQISSLISVSQPGAVKIGMLPNAEAVTVVAEAISSFQLENVVIDPVMVASSGFQLMSADAVDKMKEYLFPKASIITPNIPEAELLCGFKISSDCDRLKAARFIAERYNTPNVLIKGGHFFSHDDLLYSTSSDSYISKETTVIDTPNLHGTGCRLSTAIACFLTKHNIHNSSIKEAFFAAKDWLTTNLAENASFRFPSPLNYSRK